MTNQRYYVVVELRRYDDSVVGYSSCNLDTDISTQAIKGAVRVAGEIMVNHHTGIKIEQQKIVERLERQIANMPGSES